MLLLLNERLVKTNNFDSYRDVGDPKQSAKVYNAQDADELVFLNINREHRNITPLVNLLEDISEVCFMPLTLGGGITVLQDAENLIMNGADKVVINSICFKKPTIIEEIARKFGAQAVVVSIDVRLRNGKFVLFSDCGRKEEAVSLEDHLIVCVQAGAGEIFINSIDNDGMMNGYNIELIKMVQRLVQVPVIACGGAGNYTHMKDAFLQTHISGLACGSLFNFGDNNPIRAKAFLTNYGIQFKKI